MTGHSREDNGTVHNQTLKEPAEVCLRLELSYADEVQQREYRLVIYPGELTDQELMKQKVSEAVTKAAEEQRYEREVILPGEIAGYRLQMPSDTGRIIAVILIGGIVIMLMLWMRKRENLHREVKKQKQQLLLSYPGFVNQLQLLNDTPFLTGHSSLSGSTGTVVQIYGILPERGSIWKDNGLRRRLTTFPCFFHASSIYIQALKSTPKDA